MFNFSMVELIFLAVLALILIGPKQLPEVARTLGKFITELRRSVNVLKEDIKTNVSIEPPPMKHPAVRDPNAKKEEDSDTEQS